MPIIVVGEPPHELRQTAARFAVGAGADVKACSACSATPRQQ
jgi:hypothetical protein